MADNRRAREKRFYFSRGQLFMLAAGSIAASVFIFFLGMLVGKEIEGRKDVKKEEPVAKIPVKPLLPGSVGAASSKEELTFYDTLSRSPEAKSARKEPGNEGKQGEKLAKAEAKKETRPVAKESASVASQGSAEAESEQAASSAESQREPIAPKRAETAPAGSKSEGGEAFWSVQVNAFPDERSARIWVERLKKKGYNAYMVVANIRGRTWYRVRVGRYGTREEAEHAEEQLKQREHLTRAFATSQ